MQKQRQSHFSKLDILDRKRDFVLFWLSIQAANWHCFNKIPKHTGRRYKKTPEAAVHRCSLEKVFWKYATNFQENTHAEVQFQ